MYVLLTPFAHFRIEVKSYSPFCQYFYVFYVIISHIHSYLTYTAALGYKKNNSSKIKYKQQNPTPEPQPPGFSS